MFARPEWLLLLVMTAGLPAGCRTRPFASDEPDARTPLLYPETRKNDHVDFYHGQAVPDPYRWLEEADSPDARAWIEAQNQLTSNYLNQIPFRHSIRERLTSLWNYERYSAPIKRGSRYFFSKNDGLQNQSLLYTLRSLEDSPEALLDPNALSPDGTTALSGYAVSENGLLLAYGLSHAGSDWQEWNVRDVNTANDLPGNHLKWIKFSGASWTRDHQGFFYSRYDEPRGTNELQAVNYYQKLYYHRLGTSQSEDQLVYHRPDQKEWGFNGGVTDDGRYLIIAVRHGTDPKRRIFYQDLRQPGSPVIELLNDFDAVYEFIDNDQTLLWFRTDMNAPRGRVIAIDIRRPERADWKEIIPESADKLASVTMVNNQFIASYLKDAYSQIKIFNRDGSFAREIELPGMGTAGGFEGKRTDTESFYFFTGFSRPTTIYRYDFKTASNAVFREPRLAFNPADYQTRQIFYRSKDGTQVPMFISHRKGIRLNGKNPTLLYGYGGFDISITPSFSASRLAWMEMGGVYAVANLRGGGEYGEAWHEAGMKLHKQNVFDDFISAAQWLIQNGYTSSDKLAIEGRSNGGLLVGACIIQRPELFAAAWPAVGVMDMLRFHKFTIGWAWVSDYGSPENPEEFKALLAYSPLHNLKSGRRYPATMITTADHDDRVVPAHSFKFAAAMQAAQAGPKPVLIRIETRAGHGAGKPTAKMIEEAADGLAFLARELKVDSTPGTSNR